MALSLVALSAAPTADPLATCRRLGDETLDCDELGVFGFENVPLAPSKVESLLARVAGAGSKVSRAAQTPGAKEPVWSLETSKPGWKGFHFEATVHRRSGAEGTVVVCGAKDPAVARERCPALRRAIEESGWAGLTRKLPIRVGNHAVEVDSSCDAHFAPNADGVEVTMTCSTGLISFIEVRGTRSSLTRAWEEWKRDQATRGDSAVQGKCRLFADDDALCVRTALTAPGVEGGTSVTAFSRSDDWSYAVIATCLWAPDHPYPSFCRRVMALSPGAPDARGAGPRDAGRIAQ